MTRKQIITFYSIITLVVMVCMCPGCVMIKPPIQTQPKPEGFTIPSSVPFQLKAMAYERRGDYNRALHHLKIAQKLIDDKIRSLTNYEKKDAHRFFLTGKNLYSEGNYQEAKHFFLKSLKDDFQHKGSLYYLLQRFHPERRLTYFVAPQDTFKSIAGKIYKDKEFDFIVQFFSGVTSNNELFPGMELILPNIELSFTRQMFLSKKELLHARRLFKKGDYEQLLVVVGKILKHEPKNPEASYMLNYGCYKLGRQYESEKQYDEAVVMYEKVDPRFRNVNHDILRTLKIKKKHEREAAGIANKSHFDKGLLYMNENNFLMAREAFMRVTPGYLGLADIQEKLNKKIKLLSEKHYKKGVTFFVNEKLKNAISEWEIALTYDLKNKKIRQDIENAKRLIEKVKALDEKKQ